MGHIYADIIVKGRKSSVELKHILIDTGATYTFLSEDVLKKIGAWGPMQGVEVALGNNKKVQSRAYAVTIAIEGVEAPSICLTFKDAQPVIGVETLESIGMKLDPATEKFELTRPKGLAYFFRAK